MSEKKNISRTLLLIVGVGTIMLAIGVSVGSLALPSTKISTLEQINTVTLSQTVVSEVKQTVSEEPTVAQASSSSLVIANNGSSALWTSNGTTFRLRLATGIPPSNLVDWVGTLLPAYQTLLYVKNLSPNRVIFNPDLELLATFAFSNGTDVSRFLGSMALNSSQERVQTDDFLLPSYETLQNVTITQAPSQMIYDQTNSSTQELGMSNYSSIRVGSIELSYSATYPGAWVGPNCMSDCGNGSAKAGMKWIEFQFNGQDLDYDSGVNTMFGSNFELCYQVNSSSNCVHDDEGPRLVILNAGVYSSLGGSIFQINATSILTNVIYLPSAVSTSTSVN